MQNRENYVSVFLVLIFLESKWADKRLWADMRQAMPEFHLLLISLHTGFRVATASSNKELSVCGS